MPTVMRQQNAEPGPQMTPQLPQAAPGPRAGRARSKRRVLPENAGKAVGPQGLRHQQDTFRQDG